MHSYEITAALHDVAVELYRASDTIHTTLDPVLLASALIVSSEPLIQYMSRLVLDRDIIYMLYYRLAINAILHDYIQQEI